MKRAVDAIVVVALTIVAAAMAPLAALIVDSGRDLATALAIARGAEFPLYGPSLFGLWRPGPVWFYLLAVPLKLFGSIGAAASFAGVLAAMKVPLAWSLGRRARDAALGLAFAAFVALPGWATLAQLVVSHTMLVEAGVLATLWLCLVAAQRGSALLAALAVAMQALAVHAHPTALVAAPAVAWVVWTTMVRVRAGRPDESRRAASTAASSSNASDALAVPNESSARWVHAPDVAGEPAASNGLRAPAVTGEPASSVALNASTAMGDSLAAMGSHMPAAGEPAPSIVPNASTVPGESVVSRGPHAPAVTGESSRSNASAVPGESAASDAAVHGGTAPMHASASRGAVRRPHDGDTANGIGAVGAAGMRWGWLLVAAALFALPFLPSLVAETRAGFPQLADSAGYFGAGDYLARVDRVDDVLKGAVLGQAQFVRDFLLARWPPIGWLVFVGGLLASAIGAVGVVLGLTRDRLLPPALGLATFGWLLVLLLRDATPAWMAYAPLTLLAALLAAGWQWAWPARWRLQAARGLALFALLAGCAVLADRVATVRAGTQSLPTASIGDIAVPPQRDPPRRFWLPAHAHDAVLRRLCAAPGAVSLHGDLATALHFGQGVAAVLHCDDPARIGLGGQAARTLAGVPRELAQELGIAGERTAWGYVLATPARTVHPAAAVPLATHTRYLVDDYRTRAGRDAPQPVRVRTACTADELLVVSDWLPGLNAPFEVRAAGAPLPELRAQTIASRYYACPASGSIALDVMALDTQAVGVVLLRATADNSGAP